MTDSNNSERWLGQHLSRRAALRAGILGAAVPGILYLAKSVDSADAADSNVYIPGAPNFLELGYGWPGKEANAGKISYRKWSDALDIVGAGTAAGYRKVKIWDDLYIQGLLNLRSYIVDPQVPPAWTAFLYAKSVNGQSKPFWKDTTGTAQPLVARSATFVVAASDASPRSKLGADYVCDGTADEVEINAAIAALPTGGGKVMLSEGTFHTAAPILLVTNTSLVGQGRGAYHLGTGGATVITPAANMNDNIIELANVDVIACRIADLTIDGNKANQANGNGIYLDNNACAYDGPFHWLNNILIRNVKQDGIYATTSDVGGQLLMDSCQLLWNDGIGINIACCDFRMSDCNIGSSGLQNVVLGGANNLITACQIWGAGQITAGSGDGLHMGALRCQIIGCTFQDNINYGVSVASDAQGHDSVIVGCTFDSNGTTGSRQAGMYLWNANRITIVGCSFVDRFAGAARKQNVGIKCEGSSTTAVLVTGCHFYNNYGVAVDLGVSLPAGGVEFKNNNGSNVDGLIGDPGKAGAIPVTMSGYVPIVTGGVESRTLAAPAIAGLKLTLYMKTDGGTCTVTCATGLNQAGKTTAAFDDIGDILTLESVDVGGNVRWRITANDGVTIA